VHSESHNAHDTPPARARASRCIATSPLGHIITVQSAKLGLIQHELARVDAKRRRELFPHLPHLRALLLGG
jgi:hypothetical protein